MSATLVSKSLTKRLTTTTSTFHIPQQQHQHRNLSYLSSHSSFHQSNLTNNNNNNIHTNNHQNVSNNGRNTLHTTQKRSAMTLFEKMKEVLPRERERVKKILSEVGDEQLSQVTVQQAFNGMRGVCGLVCETSDIDIEEGIRFRGYNIDDIKKKLPTPHCRGLSGHYPCVEGMLWLLLTGEIPTDDEVKQLSEELTSEPRVNLPKHVRKVIDNLPVHQHPLAQFATGVLALQTESRFAKAYEEGVHRSKHWEFALEDTLNLIARIPFITSRIYRQSFRDGSITDADPKLDWTANWCHMVGAGNRAMGLSDRKLEMYELMRLYFMLYADHEGGNVSAHAGHMVGSTLADPMYALTAGLCGAQGPLTSLDTSEVSKMIKEIHRLNKGETPTTEFVSSYIKDLLAQGRRVPGFGHPILRRVDQRYEMMSQFAKKYLKDNDECKIIQILYDVVPPILKEHDGGKVQNPYPNLHMHGGVLLHAYGFKEDSFHPILDGMSRSFGILSQYVVARALGVSLERPKSVTWTRIGDEYCVDLDKIDSKTASQIIHEDRAADRKLMVNDD